MIVGDRRIEPLQFAAAFDDQRFQLLAPHQLRLRVQDGNSEASYSVTTPETFVYQWLQTIGAPFRWDAVLDNANWENAFREAKYIGSVTEGGTALETIEIPQRRGVRTPCIYKVYFSPDLGYLPVKYARRVEQTGEISSTMDVHAHKTFAIDGRTVAVPTLLRYTETGADGVSLKQAISITVDEQSLQVNQDVDDALFTLRADNPEWVYDVDEENRKQAAIQGAAAGSLSHDGLRESRGSTRFSLLLWGNVALIGLVVVFVSCRHLWRD